MVGDLHARHCLGPLEWEEENDHRTMMQFIISASTGDDESLPSVQYGYRNGLVSKDDLKVYEGPTGK